MQIDSIYTLLAIMDSGDQIVPVALLREAYFCDNLPGPFKRWLETCREDVNIIFEQRSINKEAHHDWDLIEY